MRCVFVHLAERLPVGFLWFFLFYSYICILIIVVAKRN
uniref:Uncharacterized protein n=1 Tax=Myoviridae sp. ctP6q2 TaxID=2825096 RepID=A0A8S5UUQ7_9CAUD|nr:MAG TPA: hypothetical protein [Myoviridae sp. ctP6q2]